jgi:hypothetical protein
MTVISKLERMCKWWPWLNLRHYLHVCLEELTNGYVVRKISIQNDSLVDNFLNKKSFDLNFGEILSYLRFYNDPSYDESPCI